MNELHIYPTSRALRTVSQSFKEEDGFLPTLMRMDEFEQRAVLLENRIQIDPLQRILLLREAAKFDAFETLNITRELVRFVSKSDAIFKFFEELAGEQVGFQVLAEADAYVEFEEELAVLDQLLVNYHKDLEARGLTDKAFIPESYRLNDAFIESYGRIEIHLEGYLSRYELALLEEVSQKTEVIIYYTTSVFNQKMQERFKGFGLSLPNDAFVSFNFSSKKILTSSQNNEMIHAEVMSVEEREEQIAIAFEAIEKMYLSGIKPENIVLILPEESFKEQVSLFDKMNNLNFAMGYDYSNGRIYKSLQAIYVYWQTYEKKQRGILERYGVDSALIEDTRSRKTTDIDTFFTLLAELELLDIPLEGKEKHNERVYERYLHFQKIFAKETLTYKEWLFLWLKALSKITLDDVRGGLVTVMGVLETRGVRFEGVVIVDFNEGIVPTSSSKDQFLNSAVRAFSSLPTRQDRESLQKQYYKRLLEQASQSVIVYSTSDNKLPSKFLYELELKAAKQPEVQHTLLYAESSQFVETPDPTVDSFDAFSVEWSASRLNTYLACKRKYYYKYIQKIKAKEEDDLNEGRFLHLLLDHLYREQSSFESEAELEKKIMMLLDVLLPEESAKARYRKLLWKEKLQGFISNQIAHFRQGWNVVEREKEFTGEIGGLRFKGRIDRIDQNDRDTLVIDYKSGSIAEANKTKNLETLTDLQMSIYHALLSKKYSNITLAFMQILEKGELSEITVLEDKNEILAGHIVELKQTTSFSAEKTDDLKRCKYCEYRLICERGEYL